MQGRSGTLFVEMPIPYDVAYDPVVREANLRALEKRDAGLARRVREASMEGLAFFRAKSGSWSLRDGDRYVASKYDPAGELRPRVAEIAADPPDIVLVFGIGLGYHLVELAASFDGLIVAYEPDPRVLAAACAVTDLTGTLAREKLVLVDRLGDLNFNVQVYTGGKVRARYEQLALPSCRQRFPDEQRAFLERVRVVQRNTDIQAETVLAKGRRWFRCLVENLPESSRLPDIGALRGRFHDMPVIVVASGPSLTRSLPALRRAKGRACLFCVGTALKKLVAAGIVPDVALGIESNDIAYQFEGVRELEAMHLMVLLKSHPSLFQLPARGRFVFGDVDSEAIWAMRAMGRRDGLVRIGGSVATAAFAVAYTTGAPAIVLVGQDLALGDGGRSHAEGTGNGAENFEGEIVVDPARRAALNAEGIELVDGYHGGLVATRFHWLSYLLWFEIQAKALAGKGVRLINATDGGAKIHGMEQMPLDRVIDEVLPARLAEDPAARLDRLAAANPPPGHATLARSLETDLRRLRSLKRLGDRSTVRIREAFERLAAGDADPRDIDRRLASIAKIEKRLLAVTRQVDSILTPLTREQVVVARNCFDRTTDRIVELRNNLNQSHLLHEGVRDAAGELIPLLESVLERLDGARGDVKLPTRAARPSALAAPSEEGVGA